MENKRRVLLSGAAVLLLVAAVWAAWVSSRPPEPLVLYGNVDIRQVNLGFRVGGRLAALSFDEGDRVPAGALLAKLDDEPYRHAYEQAEGNLLSARAHAAEMEAGYRPEEVSQAAATVAERSAALADAEAALARQQLLRGTGAAAERNYVDALSSRDQARAQLAAAQAQYALYRKGYRQEERDAARAALKQAQAALASARVQLADTVLKAPQGGVVLTRAAEAGAILAAGSTLFTLSLESPVWVRAYVAEPDLGRLAPGRAVKVFTDSRPDQPYNGVIGYISPSAEFTPKNVETPDLRTGLVYRLRVVVSNPDSGLRQGMPVTVRLADGR